MKKNYKNTDENTGQELNESLETYQTKNRIKFFNSFEAAKQDEINFIINQSPIERIQQTVALILRAYSVTNESLRNRKTNNTIRIITKK